MSAIIHNAAARINADTAGLTSTEAHQPTSGAPASFSDIVGAIPTEFGGLTHLFGGFGSGGEPTAYAPINAALEVPTAKPGIFGGLKPPRTTGQTVGQVEQAAQSVTSGLSNFWRSFVEGLRR